MNECHFIGRFVADPVLTTITKGDGKEVSMVRFCLAINRKFKNKNGEITNQVNFLEFEAWDSAAEVIAEHCRKGTLLIIRASARSASVCYEADGSKHNRIIFRVESFDFANNILGSRNVKKENTVDGGSELSE